VVEAIADALEAVADTKKDKKITPIADCNRGYFF